MSSENTDPATAVADILGPPPAELDPTAAPSRVLETILLRFLARVIHADGEIHPHEMSMLIDIAIKLQLAGDEARRILDDEFNRKSDCAVLAAQLPEQTQRREAYAMGCLMSCADGDPADSERQILADFARGGEIPNDVAERIFTKLAAAAAEARTAKPAD